MPEEDKSLKKQWFENNVASIEWRSIENAAMLDKADLVSANKAIVQDFLRVENAEPSHVQLWIAEVFSRMATGGVKSEGTKEVTAWLAGIESDDLERNLKQYVELPEDQNQLRKFINNSLSQDNSSLLFLNLIYNELLFFDEQVKAFSQAEAFNLGNERNKIKMAKILDGLARGGSEDDPSYAAIIRAVEEASGYAAKAGELKRASPQFVKEAKIWEQIFVAVASSEEMQGLQNVLSYQRNEEDFVGTFISQNLLREVSEEAKKSAASDKEITLDLAKNIVYCAVAADLSEEDSLILGTFQEFADGIYSIEELEEDVGEIEKTQILVRKEMIAAKCEKVLRELCQQVQGSDVISSDLIDAISKIATNPRHFFDFVARDDEESHDVQAAEVVHQYVAHVKQEKEAEEGLRSEEAAAVTIQAGFRGWRGRKEAAEIRKEKAATTTQKTFRGNSERERLKKEKAATTIQNAWRKHQTEKHQTENHQAENENATKIQSWFRRALQEKKVKKEQKEIDIIAERILQNKTFQRLDRDQYKEEILKTGARKIEFNPNSRKFKDVGNKRIENGLTYLLHGFDKSKEPEIKDGAKNLEDAIYLRADGLSYSQIKSNDGSSSRELEKMLRHAQNSLQDQYRSGKILGDERSFAILKIEEGQRSFEHNPDGSIKYQEVKEIRTVKRPDGSEVGEEFVSYKPMLAKEQSEAPYVTVNQLGKDLTVSYAKTPPIDLERKYDLANPEDKKKKEKEDQMRKEIIKRILLEIEDANAIDEDPAKDKLSVVQGEERKKLLALKKELAAIDAEIIKAENEITESGLVAMVAGLSANLVSDKEELSALNEKNAKNQAEIAEKDRKIKELEEEKKRLEEKANKEDEDTNRIAGISATIEQLQNEKRALGQEVQDSEQKKEALSKQIEENKEKFEAKSPQLKNLQNKLAAANRKKDELIENRAQSVLIREREKELEGVVKKNRDRMRAHYGNAADSSDALRMFNPNAFSSKRALRSLKALQTVEDPVGHDGSVAKSFGNNPWNVKLTFTDRNGEYDYDEFYVAIPGTPCCARVTVARGNSIKRYVNGKEVVEECKAGQVFIDENTLHVKQQDGSYVPLKAERTRGGSLAKGTLDDYFKHSKVHGKVQSILNSYGRMNIQAVSLFKDSMYSSIQIEGQKAVAVEMPKAARTEVKVRDELGRETGETEKFSFKRELPRPEKVTMLGDSWNAREKLLEIPEFDSEIFDQDNARRASEAALRAKEILRFKTFVVTKENINFLNAEIARINSGAQFQGRTNLSFTPLTTNNAPLVDRNFAARRQAKEIPLLKIGDVVFDNALYSKSGIKMDEGVLEREFGKEFLAQMRRVRSGVITDKDECKEKEEALLKIAKQAEEKNPRGLEEVQKLINEYKSRLDAAFNIVNSYNSDNRNPYDPTQAELRAKMLSSIMSHNSFDIMATDDFGRNILQNAAMTGNGQLVTMLLDSGIFDATVRDQGGANAFEAALQAGNGVEQPWMQRLATACAAKSSFTRGLAQSDHQKARLSYFARYINSKQTDAVSTTEAKGDDLVNLAYGRGFPDLEHEIQAIQDEIERMNTKIERDEGHLDEANQEGALAKSLRGDIESNKKRIEQLQEQSQQAQDRDSKKRYQQIENILQEAQQRRFEVDQMIYRMQFENGGKALTAQEAVAMHRMYDVNLGLLELSGEDNLYKIARGKNDDRLIALLDKYGYQPPETKIKPKYQLNHYAAGDKEDKITDLETGEEIAADGKIAIEIPEELAQKYFNNSSKNPELAHQLVSKIQLTAQYDPAIRRVYFSPESVTDNNGEKLKLPPEKRRKLIEEIGLLSGFIVEVDDEVVRLENEFLRAFQKRDWNRANDLLDQYEENATNANSENFSLNVLDEKVAGKDAMHYLIDHISKKYRGKDADKVNVPEVDLCKRMLAMTARDGRDNGFVVDQGHLNESYALEGKVGQEIQAALQAKLEKQKGNKVYYAQISNEPEIYVKLNIAGQDNSKKETGLKPLRVYFEVNSAYQMGEDDVLRPIHIQKSERNDGLPSIQENVDDRAFNKIHQKYGKLLDLLCEGKNYDPKMSNIDFFKEGQDGKLEEVNNIAAFAKPSKAIKGAAALHIKAAEKARDGGDESGYESEGGGRW